MGWGEASWGPTPRTASLAATATCVFVFVGGRASIKHPFEEGGSMQRLRRSAAVVIRQWLRCRTHTGRRQAVAGGGLTASCRCRTDPIILPVPSSGRDSRRSQGLARPVVRTVTLQVRRKPARPPQGTAGDHLFLGAVPR